MFSSIDISDFLLLNDIHLIDIRSVEKYNSSHIPGAINITYDKLISSPNNFLDKDITYYLYCQHGRSSYNVGRILANMGFKIVSISGGYESWLLSQY